MNCYHSFKSNAACSSFFLSLNFPPTPAQEPLSRLHLLLLQGSVICRYMYVRSAQTTPNATTASLRVFGRLPANSYCNSSTRDGFSSLPGDHTPRGFASTRGTVP